jgi:LDH2 family malate/lactate/ureidoglycolate dehydrogenase
MEKEGRRLVPEDSLRSFCIQGLRACGLSQGYAELTAGTLVKADMRGVSSHGVIRLPFYCQRLLDRGSNPDPKFEIVAEKPSLILVDGDNGLGQVISVEAMKMVIKRAKSQGLCFAGVRNSCHFGMAAYYPMMALAKGMIGIAGSNASPVMAPWGGNKSAIGNNPLAIAIPTGKDYPLILDMAMSVVSGGKVRLEAVKGTKIPKDWVLDRQGRPTDNPADFFPNGTLLPLGYKGFGLAIMIEVLSGVLTQSNILKEVGLWFKETSTPINLGHFFMALDVGTFMDLNSFKKRIDQMIDELKSTPLMEGSDGIFMPGEIEYAKEQACKKYGIPIDLEVCKILDSFAEKMNIPELAYFSCT